jgi:hypothetical protein
MPGTDVDVRSKVFLDRIAMLILLASRKHPPRAPRRSTKT